MKLQENKVYTNAEIAQWFGLKNAKSFTNSKEKKLNELKLFADYQLVGNKTKKIKIKKVYEAVYAKKGSQNFQKVYDQFDKFWDQSGLDSCKRVSREIYKNQIVPLTQATVYQYTRLTRNDLYGSPLKEDGGKHGKCSYLWCKQEDGRLVALTEEEQKIKRDLVNKYFGDVSDKQIVVQGMVESGEISKEEAWGVLEELTNMHGNYFMVFLKELQEKLGCKIVRGTMLEKRDEKLIESAF